MSQAARPPHRFLPTLTEVVDLPAISKADLQTIDMVEPEPDAVQLAQLAPVLDSDALIDRLMLRLDGPLQADLRNTLTTLVLDHFRQLQPLLQDEIERSVRLAVEEALSAEVQDLESGSRSLN